MQRELKILLSSYSLFGLAAGMFGPIYAVFVEQIGGDLLTAGSAYAAFSFAAGILIFLISRWEDHVKHKEKLVILGYFIMAIGFLGYILIRTPIDLFMVQIIMGIGSAVLYPAWDGIYSKHLDRGKFASEWGIWESMNQIVIGIAALFGGFLASIFGFRLIFLVMFVISLVGLAVSLLLIKRKRT